MITRSKKKHLAVAESQNGPTAGTETKRSPVGTQGSGQPAQTHRTAKQRSRRRYVISESSTSSSETDDTQEQYTLGIPSDGTQTTANMKATGEPTQDPESWKEQVTPALPEFGKLAKIKILSWNTKSLSRRLPQLKKVAYEKKPTFIVISETSLRSHQSTPRISGYPNPIRVDRAQNQQNQGGGLMIYIRKDFSDRHIHSYTTEVVPDIKDTRTGSIQLRMQTDYGSIGLYAVYRPNAQQIDISSITSILDTMTANAEDAAMLVGDINCACKAQAYSDIRKDGHTFDSYLEDNARTLQVLRFDKHTHYNAGSKSWTSPDVVIASKRPGFSPTARTGSMYGSDHRTVWTEFELEAQNNQHKSLRAPLRPKWNFQKMDTNKFCQSLTHRSRDALKKVSDTTSSSTTLSKVETVLYEALKASTPRGRYKDQNEKDPSTDEEWDKKEREIVDEIESLLEDPEKEGFSEELTELQAKLLDHNNSQPSDNSFFETLIVEQPWRAMRLLATANTKSTTTKAELDAECLKFQAISSHKDTLAFERERDSLLRKFARFADKLKENEDLVKPITLAEIDRSLRSTKPRKAQGRDNIQPEALREAARSTAFKELLQVLFNKCLTDLAIPRKWKHSELILLEKASGGFRPIALLSVLFKAYESILANRLIYVLESKLSHLFEKQYGFRGGKGCDQVLLNCMETIAQHRQLRDFVLATSIDFSKCYDRVSPHILADKIAYLTGNQKFARLILDLVSHRRIRCINKHFVSNTLTCQLGIPQGSRIACTLFIAFAFDLLDGLDKIGKTKPAYKPQPRPQPRTTPLTTKGTTSRPIRERIKAVQYADDTNIFTIASTQKEAIRLQRLAIEMILEWCERNQMLLNELKTKYCYFTGNAVIEPDPSSKNPKVPTQAPYGTEGDLVMLGFNLNAKKQFARLLEKTKGTERAIKRLHHFRLSPRHKRTYYRAVCESHVRYSAVLAPSLTKQQTQQLTSSCKRALATAIGGFSNSNPERLFKAGDCHPPIKVMQSALAKTQAEMTDDPNWTCLKHERPNQALARTIMPSTYLDNLHGELANQGLLPTCKKLPKPPAAWRYLPPIDDTKISATPQTDRARVLTYMTEKARTADYDMVFTDASIVKPSKRQRAAQQAAGAIVIWDIQPDGYQEYTESFDLGSAKTVKQAELHTLLRALRQIDIATTAKSTLIFCDNVQLLHDLKQGRITDDAAYECYELVRKLNVHVQHIPAHQGLPGNSLADDLARDHAKKALKAANEKRRSSLARPTEPLTHAAYVNKLKDAITPELRSPQLQRYLNSYKHAQIYTRLITRATFLKDFGHKTGKTTDSLCDDCGEEDSIQHFLHECPHYRKYRKGDMNEITNQVQFIYASGKKF